MQSHQSWALLVALVLFVVLGFVHYMVRKSHARPSKGFNRFSHCLHQHCCRLAGV